MHDFDIVAFARNVFDREEDRTFDWEGEELIDASGAHVTFEEYYG